MIGKVAQRREERIADIVTTAWALARLDGISGLSLHALARELGIRQPSLYAYFDSKHALFDAMFADGNQQLLGRLDAMRLPRDPRAALKAFMRVLAEFCAEDPARYELLFQRHIPGYEPSSDAYRYAEGVMQRTVERLHAAGVTSQSDVDCVVAIVAGVISAQTSNDPAGNRWTRHLNRLIDMYLDDLSRGRTR
jgi:AcrR family transcriptional regulator